MLTSKCGSKGIRGHVSSAVGDLSEAEFPRAQMVAGEGHTPVGQVLHRCLAQRLLKCSGKGRTGTGRSSRRVRPRSSA